MSKWLILFGFTITFILIITSGRKIIDRINELKNSIEKSEKNGKN